MTYITSFVLDHNHRATYRHIPLQSWQTRVPELRSGNVSEKNEQVRIMLQVYKTCSPVSKKKKADQQPFWAVPRRWLRRRAGTVSYPIIPPALKYRYGASRLLHPYDAALILRRTLLSLYHSQLFDVVQVRLYHRSSHPTLLMYVRRSAHVRFSRLGECLVSFPAKNPSETPLDFVALPYLATHHFLSFQSLMSPERIPERYESGQMTLM